MPKLQDLTGVRFGRLLVLRRGANGNSGAVRWVCRCDCGTEKEHFANGLRSGQTASCGCSQVERFRAYGKAKRKHGLSRTKEEDAYRHMMARCYNEKAPQYKNYGGRGIRVCDSWRESITAFASDMGPCPSVTHSVERIDVNGDYEPSNCRWATWKEQQRNRRNNRMVTLRGETKPLAQWCEDLGLNYARIHARLRKGWSPEKALT